MAVLGIEAHFNLLSSISPGDIAAVAMMTHVHLPVSDHTVHPNKAWQILIDALEIKQAQLSRSLKRTRRLEQFRMGHDGCFSATALCLGRQFVVQLVGCLIQDLLECLERLVFIAQHGINTDRAVAALDFGVAGHVVDQPVLDAQTGEP